jgi:hypothetical protein
VFNGTRVVTGFAGFRRSPVKALFTMLVMLNTIKYSPICNNNQIYSKSTLNLKKGILLIYINRLINYYFMLCFIIFLIPLLFIFLQKAFNMPLQ